ncbi:hypothetical protein PSE10B_39610 [Pseudomonas amygdali pv. eriobotryae]|uniref:Uncharacterized protein n=1 Tax=Pseudomonas amygdali pv. eriobotryae TaxID=129137 RepID=A0A9P3EGB2_PSEA0|nr:hypothetical protein [Pseudomonas amygdali]GFZ63232.1 hypothetical protein PSE10A_57430 [Pseudomonas amygdali pv. eriobotryae]GFZ67439.1 hypothetical protein PSE10B_39610 [Pseudomonas amygdali pv. eriobotryae]
MSSEKFTVGDMKRKLVGLDDSLELTFSGGLTFYRIKRYGDDEVYIEFDEAVGDLTDAFKKRNPGVKVAFIETSAADWSEDGIVGGPISVTVT